MEYSLRFFRAEPIDSELSPSEIAAYERLAAAPWVPPQGSFFRFRDPYPPGKPVDHREVVGWIDQVITCFYGNHTVIEIYIKERV